MFTVSNSNIKNEENWRGSVVRSGFAEPPRTVQCCLWRMRRLLLVHPDWQVQVTAC